MDWEGKGGGGGPQATLSPHAKWRRRGVLSVSGIRRVVDRGVQQAGGVRKLRTAGSRRWAGRGAVVRPDAQARRAACARKRAAGDQSRRRHVQLSQPCAQRRHLRRPKGEGPSAAAGPERQPSPHPGAGMKSELTVLLCHLGVTVLLATPTLATPKAGAVGGGAPGGQGRRRVKCSLPAAGAPPAQGLLRAAWAATTPWPSVASARG